MLEFDQKVKDYKTGEDLFQYIIIPEKPILRKIFIYKDQEFFATGTKTEKSPYSIMLAKDQPRSLPSPVDMVKKISLTCPTTGQTWSVWFRAVSF